MNPFDLPPQDPPVAFDPPMAEPNPTPRSRRSRWLLGGAAATVLGAGVLATAQLAGGGSDNSAAAFAAPALTPTPDTTPPPTATPEPAAPEPTAPDTSEPGHPRSLPGGKVVIDIGDGEPYVFEWDGGEVPDCLAEAFPPIAFPEIGELSALPVVSGEWAGSSHVVVFGPDGPTFVDLGDGDAEVTITQTDGEISVDTSGDAEQSEALIDGPFPALPAFDVFEELDEWPAEHHATDFAELEQCLSEVLGADLDELGELGDLSDLADLAEGVLISIDHTTG